jgi:hypothetical protein
MKIRLINTNYYVFLPIIDLLYKNKIDISPGTGGLKWQKYVITGFNV